MTAETALGQLDRVRAVEYEQAGQRIVRMTKPDQATARLLRPLGVKQIPALLASQRLEQPRSLPRALGARQIPALLASESLERPSALQATPV